MGGKADWLANGLPREGAAAPVPHAGDLVDRAPPTCWLATIIADVRAMLDDSGYGFCLVVNEHRILLGRVRRGAIKDADDGATAESAMEPGPSTVSFSVPAADLVRRLAERHLQTAIVTTPTGSLVGVFHRANAERQLHPSAAL